jgi:exopolysaccharide biosynthesis polyprenyl glycosylphosphotransferase
MLAFIDLACILLAFLFAVDYSTLWPSSPLHVELLRHVPSLIIFILIWAGAAIDRQLWSSQRNEGMVTYLTAITKAVGDATVVCVFIMAIFGKDKVEPKFLVAFCFATLVCLLSVRIIVRTALSRLHSMGYYRHQAILIGANDRAQHLLEVLGQPERYGTQIVGVIEDDESRLKTLEDFKLPHLGKVAAIRDALKQHKVDEIYIALPVRSHYEIIQEIAHFCEGEGMRVNLLADLFPLRIATSRLMHLEDIPLLSLATIPEAHVKLMMKRFFDFVFSSMLITLLSPGLLVLAILVKLDSAGPILFAQERVGQNQRRFKMLKFRSMVINAEALRTKLDEQNEADGPVFKMTNDPRVTKLGRFIRRYSLDEFPQLFNVWVGEMSLVGPRPPIPAEVAQYTWSQRRRLSVKPGMTGLWQVSGRNEVGFTEWVEMDLEYIDNWSLASDFIILLRTFKAVVAGRGAS